MVEAEKKKEVVRPNLKAFQGFVGVCLLVSLASAIAVATDEKRITNIAEDQILTQNL